MNCNHCRLELSEHLDGRLPSGRRGAVLDHLTECASCSDYWEELQTAQEVALSSPAERVSAAFQDGLWDRIRAGEGTPEAIFHEPIPWTAKVRYVATGGAAAAAAILFWFAFQGPDPEAGNVERRAAADASAERDGSVSAKASAARERTSSPGADMSETVAFGIEALDKPVKPVAPATVAYEAARGIAVNHDLLSSSMAELPKQPSARLDDVLSRFQEMQSFGQLLLQLEEQSLVAVPEPARGQLVMTCNLQPNTLRRSPEKLRQVVSQTHELAQLPNRVLTRQRFQLSDLEAFMEQMRRQPHLLNQFVFVSGLATGEVPHGGAFHFVGMPRAELQTRGYNPLSLYFLNPVSLGTGEAGAPLGHDLMNAQIEVQVKTDGNRRTLVIQRSSSGTSVRREED